MQAVPRSTNSQHMTDGGRETRLNLAEAMKRLRRDESALRDAVPATEAYEKALAAEERSARQVMDLAHRAGTKR